MFSLVSKQKLPMIILVVAVFAALLLLFQSLQKVEFSNATYDQARVIRFNVEVFNPTNSPVSNAVATLSIPLQKTSLQQIKRISSSHDYDLINVGNSSNALEFKLGAVAPYARKHITVTIELATSSKPNKQSSDDYSKSLSGISSEQVNYPQFKSLAKRLRKDSVRSTVLAVEDWATSELINDPIANAGQGALKTLQNKKGNTADIVWLKVSLLRAQGIPTRSISGFFYRTDRLVKAHDIHTWVEAHVDGAWHVIDTRNRNIMKNSQHYIALYRNLVDQHGSTSDEYQIVQADSPLQVNLL